MKRLIPLWITAIAGVVMIVSYFIPFTQSWGEDAGIYFDMLWGANLEVWIPAACKAWAAEAKSLALLKTSRRHALWVPHSGHASVSAARRSYPQTWHLDMSAVPGDACDNSSPYSSISRRMARTSTRLVSETITIMRRLTGLARRCSRRRSNSCCSSMISGSTSARSAQSVPRTSMM